MSIHDALAVAWDDGYQVGPRARRAAPATWVPDAPTPDPRRATGHCPTCGHAINGTHHCTHQEDS